MKTSLCLAVVLPVLALTPASAQQTQSPFEVIPSIDLPLTLGAGLIGLLPDLLKSELGNHAGGGIANPYNREDVNAWDRTVIGNSSRAATQWSDGLVLTGLALPHALGVLDQFLSRPGDGWNGYARDTWVILETLSINYLISNLVKFSVRRPRPYLYDPATSEETRMGGEATLSFYSSHTSNAFSMATAYSLTFQWRHPESPWRWPVWIGSHALATTVGVLRVEAGKHFWTDVLTGATLGSLLGWMIPSLHKRDLSKTTSSPPPGFTWSIAPLGLAQGMAFTLAW